ncbi:hypothetical protein GBA52_012043 [Prunus armeniaca]|nr:hypothetical protein GBA52_012043 [Prunus armeniaca]
MHLIANSCFDLAPSSISLQFWRKKEEFGDLKSWMHRNISDLLPSRSSSKKAIA